MAHRSDLVPSDYEACTPSDTTGVAYRGIYVGVGGDVALKGASGVAVTFKNVPTGAILPGLAQRVMATNTTATNIVGFLV